MKLESVLQALEGVRADGVGVRDWSLLAREGRRLSLGIKDGEVGNAHAPLNLTESCSAGYKLIWDDGRVSRGNLERKQLDADPAGAFRSARTAAFEDEDAAWVLGASTMPDVATYDDATAAIAGGETALLARRLESVRERIARFQLRTWSGSFSASEGEARLLTSAGLDAADRSTSIGWHVTLNGEIGDGFGARRPETDDDFEQRLDRLVEMAARLEQPARPMEAGVRPVLLHPGVVERYVLDTLLSNLGGSTVAHGDGHFRRDQFGSGEVVLREDLGLRIDPLRPYMSGAYRFTAEGLPAAPCAFIERGRLVQPVLGLKYARRLGLEPTPLPSGTDTMFLEGPPPLPLETALARADGGALVLSVLGIHTQDSASGDFSLLAPQVLAIGPDGLAGRMRATISGNLFDLLSSPKLAFVTFAGEHTPGLLWHCRLDPRS